MKNRFSSKIVIAKITMFALIFFTDAANLCAQKSDEKILPDGCETVNATLADVGNEFMKSAEPYSFLVIIGVAANGEKSAYNERRVADAIKWYNLYKFKSEKIVYGTAKSSNKLGSLKFYINGKFYTDINWRKNRKLCFSDGWSF